MTAPQVPGDNPEFQPQPGVEFDPKPPLPESAKDGANGEPTHLAESFKGSVSRALSGAATRLTFFSATLSRKKLTEAEQKELETLKTNTDQLIEALKTKKIKQREAIPPATEIGTSPVHEAQDDDLTQKIDLIFSLVKIKRNIHDLFPNDLEMWRNFEAHLKDTLAKPNFPETEEIHALSQLAYFQGKPETLKNSLIAYFKRN